MRVLMLCLLLTGCASKKYVTEEDLQFRIGLFCNNQTVAAVAENNPEKVMKIRNDCRESFGYPAKWDERFDRDSGVKIIIK